jgi:hypothetical protein
MVEVKGQRPLPINNEEWDGPLEGNNNYPTIKFPRTPGNKGVQISFNKPQT